MSDRKPEIIHAEFEIGEVFEYFAQGLECPKDYTISNVTPHYDPRLGTVIFRCYCEPIEMTIPADQSYPVDGVGAL
jgi:hypothetical protein